MSYGARWFLAIVMLLMGVSFAWVAITGLVAPMGCWGFAAFCFLIAIVCVSDAASPIAARILGVIVFLACLGYLVSEIRHPTGNTLDTYRRSNPNLPNAIIVFVIAGIPAAICAIKGNVGSAFTFKRHG